MQNVDQWKPSKFELRRGRWRAARKRGQIPPASLMAADLQVTAYTEMLARHAHGDLLDLGCGFVPLYAAYRDLVTSVTCADWPNTLHANPHLDVAVDLTEPLPLPDAAFDTVLLTDVLEHLPTPELAMKEVARILRPTGVVLIGVPFMYGIHEAPHDYHRYTEHRLRQLCVDQGLSVQELDAYGDGLHTLADQFIKQVSDRLPVAWLTRLVARIAVRHRPRTGSQTPLGYWAVACKV